MEVELATIGGYEEVGRQMTAVRAGDNVVIFDMGLNLSKVLLHDDVMTERMHSLDLIDMGAIPDDRVMSDVHGEVQAIVPTHGHLDHIGALPKLAHRYDAPIVGTPYTIELVKQQIQDEEKFNVDNDLVEMDAGETMSIGDGDDVDLEFVNVTHSIPDAVNPILHTPEGAVVYGLDKRIDYNPVIGEPFNMSRFREVAQNEGVLAYVEDCTNAGKKGRTYSESIARAQLKDVMESVADYDGGILATTFSSHIARVSSLVEFARSIDRTPLLLGRSMNQYSSAAQRLGIADFEGVEMYGYKDEIDQALNRVMNDGKGEYLPVVTGHQGEPRAMMTQIARGETAYELDNGDKVIFSAGIIPEPMNEGQRHQLEQLLGLRGARVYSDVHVSGHLRQEGLYTMLNTLNPDNVIPAHQTMSGVSPYVNMAEDEGYVVGRDLHPSRNGDILTLVDD